MKATGIVRRIDVLGREDEGLLTLDDFKDALVNTYDLYRTELLRYCRS